MSATIFSSGIDWVTMTSREDKMGYGWWEHYVNYRAAMSQDEPTEVNYSNGFYAGVRCGQLQWGYSDSLGYILIASGAQAEKTWRQYQPAKVRVTRIDLMVDFRLRVPMPLAANHFVELKGNRDRQFPKLTLWENTLGGSTLYVGSRQSQQYGRLYDKGNESGTDDNNIWWRAEVEYKKPLADEVGKALYATGSADRYQKIVQTVSDWYEARGIPLPIAPSGVDPLLFSVIKRVSTTEKKLTWLRTQVSPTVVQLIELGLAREVYSALSIMADMQDDKYLKTLAKSKRLW